MILVSRGALSWSRAHTWYWQYHDNIFYNYYLFYNIFYIYYLHGKPEILYRIHVNISKYVFL